MNDWLVVPINISHHNGDWKYTRGVQKRLQMTRFIRDIYFKDDKFLSSDLPNIPP